MRRGFALLLLTVLLVCGGCSQEEDMLQEVLAFRTGLVQAGGCSFQCTVTADFGESVEEFSLDCRGDREGCLDMTILEPEVLRGITARVTSGGGEITYEGLSVDFGLLAQGNVSPAAAGGLVLDAWLKGYISGAGREGEYCRAVFLKELGQEQLRVETYFKNGLPNYAQVCYNNQGVLTLRFTEFQLE